MRRPGWRPRAPENVAVWMAGWLFADLMLVLFLVGLGSEPTVYPTPTPSPTETIPTPEPAPTPTPTPQAPPALAKDPITIPLTVEFAELLGSSATRAAAGTRLRQQLAVAVESHNFTTERAGMVLVWTFHKDPGAGTSISRVISEEIAAGNDAFFSGAVMRPFWSGNSERRGTVELEIYVIE